MSIVNNVQNIVLSILHALKANVEDYCDLETTDGPTELVFKNGGMMTLIRYDGLLSMITRDIFDGMNDRLTEEMAPFLNKSGHKVCMMFRRDLDANSSLQTINQLQKQTCERLNLDLGYLIDENTEIYEKYIYDEECYIALITLPSVLDKVERENHEEYLKSFIAPAMKDAQNLSAPIPTLRARHSSFVEKFITTINNKDFYVKAVKVNILDALAVVRHQVAPNTSDRRWRPAVALGAANARELGIKYRTPLRWPTTSNSHDFSHMLPPSLPEQIMFNNINILGPKEGLPPNTIATDGRLYATTMMNIPPTQPAVFEALFNSFNESSSKDSMGRIRSMPYSICFMLTGDGYAGHAVKKAFMQFLSKVPPSTNENLKAATSQLLEYKRADVPLVAFQISAMTWCDDDAFGREEIRKRRTRLIHTLSTWGGMSCVERAGDPVSMFTSNIIGLSDTSIAPKGVAPLPRAFEMMPFTRPASPFYKGTVLRRTQDGKAMILERFSSELSTWISLYSGRPGSGKSVSLNNDLTETCFMPGIERLPYITVIDVGISSTGFINQLRNGLPKHQRYLAVTKQLRKSREYAINPFDIKVGLTRPLETEKNQMASFLTSLLTPKEKREPYNGTYNFVLYLITEVFESVNEGEEKGSSKIYRYGYAPELDDYLINNNIIRFGTKQVADGFGGLKKIIDGDDIESVSYYELTRRLHVIGTKFGGDERALAWRARDLAHRNAMPTLDDIVKVLNKPETTKRYKNKIETEETIVEYASRVINEVINNYPCFANTTRFDVDTARVVALDLNDVVDVNNPQQTSLFYQIARMVGVKKISLTEQDIESEAIPDLFKPYYRDLFREISQDRKILAMDEMHNLQGEPVLMAQLEKDCREGRKWGLEVILASQRLIDFKRIVGYATTLNICSEPAGEDLALLRENFRINDTMVDQLSRISLGREGLSYFSYIVGKTDIYCSMLTMTVGPKRLWSLTTDADDRILRQYMFDIAGDRKTAINALAFRFPGGARNAISDLREQVKLKSSDLSEVEMEKEAGNLIENLARETLSMWDQFQLNIQADEQSGLLAFA